jgi:predicted GNAT family acetyltransferase
MGLKCRISYNNGTVAVTDEKGNESQLYKELLAHTGNEAEALNLWTVANSKELMNAGETATVSGIEAFLDSNEAINSRLSTAEEFQVVDFMRRTGEESLDALNQKLAKIFKPNGTFGIDVSEAISSGIFSQQEIRDLDMDQIQDILLKIEGRLLSGDIIVEPDSQYEAYVNSDVKTVFGTSQKTTQKEFDNDIIRVVSDFSNKNSFLSGIKELPYSEFTQRFQEDEAFSDSVMERFSGLKKIPVVSVVGRSLSSENNTVYTTVKNTILVNNGDVSIEAEIDYLNSVPQDVWEENVEDMESVLKEVEQTLADTNIDVVGISKRANNRDGVMRLLYAANVLSKQATEENLSEFVDSHKAIIGTPTTIIAEKLDAKYDGLNIVSFKSDKGADFLFENHGLIEIGENLYHKVEQGVSTDVMRDFIYDQFIAGEVQIPSEFINVKNPKDIANKPAVIEGISAFLMSRPNISKIKKGEVYSAYQVAFNHSPVASKEASVKSLSRIRTDEKYLKGEFISDFYNYILNEKVKDSILYRGVLSKFQVNDNGISLIEKIPSIENLEYSEQLADYIRLHRDSNMKYLVVDKGTSVSEDLLFLNFPEKTSEFEGKVILDENFAIVNTTADNYIKIAGELYRKEISRNNADLFVKINSPSSNTYFTSNLNFDFDRTSANKAFNEYATLDPATVSFIDYQSTVAKSRLNDNMSSEFKELSTLKDKSYVFTEIEGVLSATKDGVEVGTLTYKSEGNSYVNPKVAVSELHRGKGIGTELYLQLFDKAKKNNKVVDKPAEETPQSKNIFERIGSRTAAKERETVIKATSESAELLDNLIESGEVTFVNDETNLPCLKAGANLGFTPGSKWKVVKEFKGNSHERGGIDITVGKDSIKMTSKEGDIKAKYGVTISSKTLK